MMERVLAASGTIKTIVGLALCLAFGARAVVAQTPPQAPAVEPQHDVDALAKQTQNQHAARHTPS